MARLPEGTITFVLTDLQGSTQIWEAQPMAMRRAMSRHDEILVNTVQRHDGALVETGREGDSVLAVFRTAAAAAACALDIQKDFATESWPQGLDLRVRVALHTGEAQLREGHYFGAALNRCARLLGICHPGQILLSKAAESMLADELPANTELHDLGLHRLRDLVRPEEVFQLNDLSRPTTFPAIQSPQQRQTNMPTYLTTFVGRNSDLSELRSLYVKSRMITLTGAGGSGKTRLAAELAQACVDLSPGGVWWVGLAPVTDPREVPSAVVASLELPGRGPALDVVAAWLSPRQALLVLDNCEHLVAACAEFCQAVLHRCPQLKLIATSREYLGVPGEARWPVSSLVMPDAVQLFEARASLVRPDFKVTASNLDAVTEICERLDGMPLAIELAAARTSLMTEREILNQLADRFRLLRGRGRTAPERQQTMIATIDWSYRLLSADEALFFRRLSVFRGGFTLASVQAICGGGMGGTVLETLAGLVQKSMVVADVIQDAGSRYRLLESQLAYAEDQLRSAGELELIRRNHYQYFHESLTSRTWAFVGSRRVSPSVGDAEWKVREWSNLWAALDWACENADDLGLSLAVDLSRATIEVRPADLSRLRTVLTDLLSRSPATGPPRLKALQCAASSAYMLGDYESAIQIAASTTALGRELGDLEAVANALCTAGDAHSDRMEFVAAAELYEEALSLLIDSTNRHLVAVIRMSVADLAAAKGDYATASQILVECVASAKAEGDLLLIASTLDSLAAAQLGLGHRHDAAGNWKEALSIWRSLNISGALYQLAGLSCVASASGDDQRALFLAAAANRLVDEWSLRLPPTRLAVLEESVRKSRSRFGTRTSEQAWNQGWAMTLDQAIDYALGESDLDVMVDVGPLSRRQREVATLVAAGLTNREIAERLFIAERSAEGHVERIRNKLGVRSRTEVAAWAVEHGLTAPPTKERGTRDGSLPTRRGRPT